MTLVHPLSDIAEVFNGKTPSKAEQRSSGHPVLKIKNVSETGNFRGEFESFVDPTLAVKHQLRWLRAGDSLILNAAHNADYVASKMFFAGESVEGAMPTGEWLVVRPNPEFADPAFVNFWLRSTGARKSIKFMVKGIHLYPKDVAALSVPIPPLPEQRRIVDLLSRAEGIVRLRREAEKKAAELIPSLFIDMFGSPAMNPKGWPVATIGELLTDGPQNGLYKHGSHYGEGTPILRIDAFYDGQVRDLKTLKRVTLSPDECARFRLRPRDLIINRVNSPEYLGKSTIIPALDEDTVFESNMMRLTFDEARVLPEYVIELLQTAHAKAHFLSKAKHAINQSSINQQDVKSLGVPIPTLSIQRGFVDKVGQVRSIQSQQSTATTKAKATFNALLAQAFSAS